MHFCPAVFFRVTHDGLSERGATRSLKFDCIYQVGRRSTPGMGGTTYEMLTGRCKVPDKRIPAL